MRLFGRRVDVETVRLEADEDGVIREPCWFCGSVVELAAGTMTSPDVALLSITQVGSGESVHGMCHPACVERAHGSLAL